jgi:hypothetical protein
MQVILRILALSALATLAAPALVAAATPLQSAPPAPRPLPKQNFVYHYEWTHGAVLTPQEWQRGASIDPRRRRLPPPPPGKEWREIDGNDVLASRSTHVIVRVVAAPHPTVPGRSGGEP